MVQFIANFLYTEIQTSQQKQQQRRLGTINFKKYAQPYYIVERGSIDEQINFIHLSLDGKATDEVNLKQFEMVRHRLKYLRFQYIKRSKSSIN